MDIFHVLTMLGGLCLFLFGMNFMGQSLERRAGGKLRTLLDKMTGSVGAGFLTGLGITAIIQSSSATTVMVVGFVNSGLMNLRQAINVIMGANVGTTVTAWLLSLAGIDGGSTWVQLLKPTSFTPVLALVGIVFYMFCKDSRKKDTGAILLGFATLMFGMDTMSGAVAGLKDVPGFAELFLAFTNPLLGVLVGAVLTGVIQSSSASVGILQALAGTGQVSYAAAVPIIMGQNIGTCVTALISCVGTNKNAKRAAVVHLMFNVIGVAVLLTVFCIVKAIFAPALLNESAGMAGIAIAHSAFNILCTAMLLPLGGQLENAFGIDVAQLVDVARCGINKINVDTDIRLACTRNLLELFEKEPELRESASVGQLYKDLKKNPKNFDPRNYVASIMDTITLGVVPDAHVQKIVDCMKDGVTESIAPLLVQFGSYRKSHLIEVVTCEQMAERYKKAGI